ncbi:MAG: histidine--tRNA ligase [Gammaproteobacteria bacterium]|nr:histidine--tRNA ligase [Gammaproteobacteria bacterium]MYG14678.1 histidine--tRNA ligase [Gammaproteobacteria bacterium]MYK28434.1 histidine--tRNA ligase [Gammaproteobacteria bacterium]
MRDVLPDEARRWRAVEEQIVDILDRFAYEELRLPLLEMTELFARSVGASTDIVEKEMYSLIDRDGNSISLRPEGTASCARALLESGLLRNQAQRVFYRGPMFRHERPQMGRFRQFHQVGVEVFGPPGPDVDAELIQVGTEIWRALDLSGEIQLELNTLGAPAARAAWRDALAAYLRPHGAALDADSARRLDRNPLRILDSKSAATQELLADAPNFDDYIDDASAEHFEALKGLLDELGIAYVLNPRLVRGLDYYGRTVFEWTTERLGAQGTVCAGGRYDGLVEIIGGKPTAAAGFALGLERVLLLQQALHEAAPEPAVDVYCCVLEPQWQGVALAAVQRLREGLPGLRFRVHAGGGSLKSQLKRADQCGARWALLFGEDELRDNRMACKDLRSGAPQEVLTAQAVIERLLGETA